MTNSTHTPHTGERWLKVSDLVKAWDCSDETIRRAIRSGHLKARRMSRKGPYQILATDADEYRRSLVTIAERAA